MTPLDYDLAKVSHFRSTLACVFITKGCGAKLLPLLDRGVTDVVRGLDAVNIPRVAQRLRDSAAATRCRPDR